MREWNSAKRSTGEETFRQRRLCPPRRVGERVVQWTPSHHSRVDVEFLTFPLGRGRGRVGPGVGGRESPGNQDHSCPERVGTVGVGSRVSCSADRHRPVPVSPRDCDRDHAHTSSLGVVRGSTGWAVDRRTRSIARGESRGISSYFSKTKLVRGGRGGPVLTPARHVPVYGRTPLCSALPGVWTGERRDTQ